MINFRVGRVVASNTLDPKTVTVVRTAILTLAIQPEVPAIMGAITNGIAELEPVADSDYDCRSDSL